MPDSWGYIQIAENLYHFGAFSQSPNPHNLYPDSMRTPLYPALLWVMYVFKLNIQWLLLLQIALNVHIIYLVFLISKNLGLNLKASLFASALFSLSLPSIFFTNTVMTESIFQWMLVVSVYYLLQNNSKQRFLAFLNFGLAFMLRPAILALPLFIAFGAYFKNSGKKLIVSSLLIFLLFPAFWIARNKATFDKFMISPVLEINLFFHYLPEFLPKSEMDAFLKEKTKTEGNIPLKEWLHITRSYSFKMIKKYPAKALLISFTNPIKTFLFPIRSYFDFQFKKDFSWKIENNMVNRILNSHWSTQIAIVFQILISLITLLGIIYGFPQWKSYWLIWMFAAYFILTSAISVPDPRFRVPAEPFLAILGGIGLNKLIDVIKAKKATS